MPVSRGYTTKNGDRVGYYQFGSQTRYFYTPGNEQERKRAKQKAKQQQQAAYASGSKG